LNNHEVRFVGWNWASCACLLPVLLGAAGCGAVSSAANPKVAPYIKEQAPLTIVVERADAAATTSREVERLLTETPVNADWPKELALGTDRIRQTQSDQAARFIYAGKPYAIVASVVWARTLTNIKLAPPPDSAASAAEAAPTTDSGSGATDSAAGTTGSATGATTPSSDQGASSGAVDSNAASGAVSTPGPKLPVNLLAAIAPDLATDYTTFETSIADLSRMEAAIDAEKKAASEATTDADKQAHTKAAEAKQAELDHAKAAIEPLRKDFLLRCKAAAAKAAASAQTFGPVVVNLRQAVDDAETANGAAVVAYPLAAKDIKNQVVVSAEGNLTDLIYEQTGHRLQTRGTHVNAGFDGSKVNLSLNGMTPDDLGKVDPGELVTQTLARTQSFVEKALLLLDTTSRTEGRLEFEADMLDALLDGFKASGWSAPDAVYVPEQGAVQIAAGAPLPTSRPSMVSGLAHLFGK